jgi:hypothetical protein
VTGIMADVATHGRAACAGRRLRVATFNIKHAATAALGDFNADHDQVGTWLSGATPLQLARRPAGLAPSYRQSDHIAVNGLEIASVSASWTAISDHPVVLARAGGEP